ncbi:MAG: AI-2E family transporter [Bacillota bacterium]|nr:AI-2E family transporter [Bacillota bacterium]
MTKKHQAYILIAGIAFTLILLFCFFSELFYLVFSAVVFAYLLEPMVKHFTRKSMPKAGAIGLSYGIIGVILLFFMFVVLPQLYKEGLGLFASAEKFIGYFMVLYEKFTAKVSSVLSLSLILEWEGDILPFLEEKIDEYTSNVLSRLMEVPKSLSYLLLAPVIAYYFLRDSSAIGGRLLTVFPPQSRSSVLILAKETDTVIRGFIRGNLLVSLAVAVVTTGGLWLIGVDYPLLLGILNGVFDIIPYFGPILGAVPVILFALLQPDVNMAWVILLLFGVQQMENIFISPRVIGDCVGLHPVSIILLVFLGGSIGGILGMVLIIPIAAVGKVLLTFFYEAFVGYRFH